MAQRHVRDQSLYYQLSWVISKAGAGTVQRLVCGRGLQGDNSLKKTVEFNL